MIKPISTAYLTCRADTNSKNPITGEYKDPLMHWPLRGAAFTNEVGEALRPLIGKYATLSWAPALLYIGADIYDKYKNDQTEYSPNSHRCLQQAVFQGMASILLPLVAVKAGQNLFSFLGFMQSDRLSINAKEQIADMAKTFVANGKMRAYDGKDEECIKEFLEITSDNMDYNRHKTANLNKMNKIFIKIQDFIHNTLKINTKERIEKYSEKVITDLIKLRKDMLNPTEEFLHDPLYSLFANALKEGQTKSVAVKSVLNKSLESGALLGKTVNTLGGFLALGLTIKPIDNFVENVLIGQIVAPGLEKTKKESV